MLETPQETGGLELRLFGPFSVCVGGQPVAPPRTRKGFWLLALLALRHGRDVERRWLAYTLWPDSAEEQALYNLRRSLSDLRAALGTAADCLVSPTPRTLRLAVAPDAVDVVPFDAAIARGDIVALDTAIALYAGPLLEGCDEEWAQPERESRENAYLTALETRAALALEQKEMERAERLARRAIATDLRRETAWRLLLTALARSGNRTALTTTYRDLRLRLRYEYHRWPDPQTTALFETLRAEARPPADATLTNTPQPQTRNVSFSNSRTLPDSLTPLIGREKTIAEVTDALQSSRLLTLTGAGGIGKTRLALAAAQAARGEFPDGIWFVDLSAAIDPNLLPSQVAHLLNVREEAGNSIRNALCRALLSGDFLLVLDNCEHLLAACAELSSALLGGTENLKILATSRTPLGIPGERTWRVPSLSVPLPESPPSHSASHPSHPAALMDYAAVRLFVERTEHHRPDFQLTAENAQAVVEICRCLDGIPLALELAAARSRHLEVTEIARRLDRVVSLLTGGSRLALPQRQTLRASIDWSWSLLNRQEQEMLARLSVFAGGFTLEAAEAVCGMIPLFPVTNTGHTDASHASAGVFEAGSVKAGSVKAGSVEAALPETDLFASDPSNAEIMPGDDVVLDLLGALIDHSLILYPSGGAVSRYRLPETIRQFAAGKLAESNSETRLRERHAAFYLALVEKARLHLQGGQAMTVWLDVCEQEHDNLRRALEWYEPMSNADGAEKGLRLAGALLPFWLTRGYYTEGRRRLTSLLARTEALPAGLARAAVLNGVGQMTAYQGDREAAHTLHQQALALCREDGDGPSLCDTLNHLGELARQQERYDDAETYFQEALSRLPPDEPSDLSGRTRYNLGTIFYRTGRPSEAHLYFEQALAAFGHRDSQGRRALPLIGLAHIAWKLERTEQAYQYTQETLKDCAERGDVYLTVFALELSAQIARLQDRAIQAAHLVGAATALRERLGNQPTRVQQTELDTLRGRLRETLGPEGFAAAFAEGCSLALPQAMELAMANPSGPER